MYYTNSLTNFTTTSLLIASFFSYPPPEERYDYAKRLKLAIAELQKVGILTILWFGWKPSIVYDLHY